MTSQSNCIGFLNEANRQITKNRMKKILKKALNPSAIPNDLLVTLDVDPLIFRDTYMYNTVFSKYCSIDKSTELERDRRCLEKYLNCEKVCRETNDYFANEGYRGTSVHHLLMLTRKHLSNILGSLPDNWYEGASFGPGSTTSLRKIYSDPVFKLENKPHVTSLFAPFARSLWSDLWPEMEIRDYAEYTSVPKNAEINRPIEKQTDLNIYAQKALGSIIRKRMFGRYCGAGRPALDLNSQENNRLFALLGSGADPSICTVDLSSASDLISVNLVKYLVEDNRWLQALYLTRVGQVQLDGGNIIHLQKFSAMGNGYTWELQSAIFYSMIRACNEYLGFDDHICSIFGDDIICHKDVYPTLAYLLRASGLKVNHDKSFVSGWFRESCGKHFYKGVDVTPPYLRKPLQTNEDIVVFHNRIFEWSTRLGYKDIRLKPLMEFLSTSLSCKLLYCPPKYGDCALHACRYDLAPKTYWLRKYDGIFYTKVWKIYTSTLTWNHKTALIKWLHGYRSLELSAYDIPFGIRRARVGRLSLTGWPSFGSWM